MIDPNAVSTIRVGELSPEPFSLTDNVPHEVGTELKRGTIEDLATFISAFIGSTDGVGFRAISVTDGQTLPTTTQQEFILVGKGTYYNVVGGSTIICTEELNAIVSNGSYWFIGVEIPVNVELAGITQFIRDGFINTTPSEDTVFDALALKANVADSENIENKQNDLTPDGTGTKYPTVDAVNTIDLQKVLNTNGSFSLSDFSGNIDSSGILLFNNDVANAKSSTFQNTFQGTYVESVFGTKTANIGVFEGVVDLRQANVDGVTVVGVENPITDTTLNFPAKAVAGTYTLATTDEISTLDSNVVHKNGFESITGQKHFANPTGQSISASNNGSAQGIIVYNGSSSTGEAILINNGGSGNSLELYSTFGSTGKPLRISNVGVETLYFTKTGNITANSYIKKGGTSTQTLMADGSAVQLVTQTITNGVTDKSPSEDAVFDALALKVGGSGTANLLAKFTASGTVANSTITDNGTNVGIGNASTSPAENLEVRTTGNSGFAMTRNASTNAARFYFKTGTTYNWSVGVRSSRNDYSIFNETLSEAFTINATTNNVLIGTTTDNGISGDKLQVSGAIAVSSTIKAGATVRLKNYTVATLPTGVQGDTAYVTDALAPTYLGALVGGGAVVCPVFFNGAIWVSH